MALTGDLVAWLTLRALAGVASASVLVFVSAWCLGALAPLGRPQLQSAVFAGVGVGTAVAGAVCLALMQAEATSAAPRGRRRGRRGQGDGPRRAVPPAAHS